MPNGGLLLTDASWTSSERWATHSHPPGEPNQFCPDFVEEIRSGSDNLAPLQAKMQFYMQNGARLGWLIYPQNRRMHVYRVGEEETEVLGLIDNWTKPGCGGRAETEYQEVQ